jgi:hypothetical protein
MRDAAKPLVPDDRDSFFSHTWRKTFAGNYCRAARPTLPCGAPAIRDSPYHESSAQVRTLASGSAQGQDLQRERQP